MNDVPEFVRLKSLDDCSQYLKVMLDFYFDVIAHPACLYAESARMSDCNLWVQTIFNKCNNFRNLLNGCCYPKGENLLYEVIDNSVLNMVARAIYESLIVFELLYVLPKTDDERTILYNLFMAQGLAERLKDLDDEMRQSHPERIAKEEADISACKQEIEETTLYQHLDAQAQNALQQKIGKSYRIRFTEEGTFQKVNFDDAYKYLGVKDKPYHGVYSYQSLYAHPSYLFLCQFREAYKDNCQGSVDLAKFTTQCVLSYMSIFIIDFIKLNSELQNWFNNQDSNRQFLIGLYEDAMRGGGKYSNSGDPK